MITSTASCLAHKFMEEFSVETGLVDGNPPRRYLWTDAFAVCNYVGLYRKTGEERYLLLARSLVNQVHHILGRHRSDDVRTGWISQLPDLIAEQHPTARGLRIGKALPERREDQPFAPRQEWDRDGQYFHYLTKWVHALHCMGEQTNERDYLRWACELATVAHRAFTREQLPTRQRGIIWKMSIDLTRPLVLSMGQHDPLDGLIVCLELQTAEGVESQLRDELESAAIDMAEMCQHGDWPTNDPLGIGGLLDDTTRLARLQHDYELPYQDLLHQLLMAAEVSLIGYVQSLPLRRWADHRLAFRELGLSIGLHAAPMLLKLVSRNRNLSSIAQRLQQFHWLAKDIEQFWAKEKHRLVPAWQDHRDINSVMLATSLEPTGYLKVQE